MHADLTIQLFLYNGFIFFQHHPSTEYKAIIINSKGSGNKRFIKCVEKINLI